MSRSTPPTFCEWIGGIVGILFIIFLGWLLCCWTLSIIGLTQILCPSQRPTINLEIKSLQITYDTNWREYLIVQYNWNISRSYTDKVSYWLGYVDSHYKTPDYFKIYTANQNLDIISNDIQEIDIGSTENSRRGRPAEFILYEIWPLVPKPCWRTISHHPFQVPSSYK